MKTFSFLSLVGFCLPVFSAFTLNWNNAYSFANPSANRLLDSDGSTFLVGDRTDGSVGYFAQLIWTGSNGMIDPLDINQSDGTGGDDVVVGFSHIGFNMGFDPPEGNINASTSVATGSGAGQYDVGDQFYVRVFNAASPNFGTGLAPTPGNGGSATNYGDSSTLYTVTSNNVTNGDAGLFQTGSIVTNQVAIPEPSTFALAAVAGLVFIRLRNRNRR